MFDNPTFSRADSLATVKRARPRFLSLAPSLNVKCASSIKYFSVGARQRLKLAMQPYRNQSTHRAGMLPGFGQERAPAAPLVALVPSQRLVSPPRASPQAPGGQGKGSKRIAMRSERQRNNGFGRLGVSRRDCFVPHLAQFDYLLEGRKPFGVRQHT